MLLALKDLFKWHAIYPEKRKEILDAINLTKIVASKKGQEISIEAIKSDWEKEIEVEIKKLGNKYLGKVYSPEVLRKSILKPVINHFKNPCEDNINEIVRVLVFFQSKIIKDTDGNLENTNIRFSSFQRIISSISRKLYRRITNKARVEIRNPSLPKRDIGLPMK